MEDLITLKNTMGAAFVWIKRIWSYVIKIKNLIGILRFGKNNDSSEVQESLPTETADDTSVGVVDRIKFKIWPRAKLTYWLADEEVIIYVSDFKQKDKFKIIFKELETGRLVLVNSANPINYRLEQVKPEDKIEKKITQQDQKY